VTEESNGNGGRPELTSRQLAFVNVWFGEARFNATRAAELAGYGNGSGNVNTWRSYGCQTLANLNVQAEIKRRWAAHGVTEEEVISTLVRQMRGKVTDLLRGDKLLMMLDPEAVRENGHLVKSIRWTKSGTQVELYDAQRAAELVGKSMGMFKDQVEVSADDKFLGVLERIAARPKKNGDPT